MNNRIISILLLLVFFMLQACHKCNDPGNPDCKNYNPCYGQSAVNANFTIQEADQNNTGWIPYFSDTCRADYIVFNALLDGAQYEWHIGSGVYTTQSVSLSFLGAHDGDIPITLIVTKAPNKACFPTDDGVDTVLRILHIRSHYTHIYGTYYGCFTDSPSYKFSVTLLKGYPPAPWNTDAYDMAECDSAIVQSYGWPIPATKVAGSYPCGLIYQGLRELIFNVQPPDSIHYTSYYTSYEFCDALLDSTYNNITINIHGTRPASYDTTAPFSLVNFGKTFIGTRQ